MITGGPGSGKSWLARHMGDITGLPVTHMDHIHWKPGWVERGAEEKMRLVREVYARDAWIVEGGHSRSYPERLARSDTVIWLDIPLPLRLWRVIRRTFEQYGQTRPDLPENCPERFGAGKLELIWYMLRTNTRNRRRLETIFADPPPQASMIHLVSRREVGRFLATVREEAR
jgi:adenylate kinase family enzyme